MSLTRWNHFQGKRILPFIPFVHRELRSLEQFTSASIIWKFHQRKWNVYLAQNRIFLQVLNTKVSSEQNGITIKFNTCFTLKRSKDAIFTSIVSIFPVLSRNNLNLKTVAYGLTILVTPHPHQRCSNKVHFRIWGNTGITSVLIRFRFEISLRCSTRVSSIDHVIEWSLLKRPLHQSQPLPPQLSHKQQPIAQVAATFNPYFGGMTAAQLSNHQMQHRQISSCMAPPVCLMLSTLKSIGG